MIKNRDHVWLLLLGAILLLTISAAFGQDKCTNQSGWIGAGGYCPVDQKYAREQERRIKVYSNQIRDLERNMDMSEVNQWYLLTLKLDRTICDRHLLAYLNGEDRKELDRAINQLSRDMENVPPGFRTVKQ